MQIIIDVIKTDFKHHFTCRETENAYLCSVFFIVLDLRLTKVGVQRNSFFYALMRNASFLLSPKTLIKLHFTVSQIAVLSAISPTSVYQQKSRMKKRIQALEPELFTDGETLDEWLNEW